MTTEQIIILALGSVVFVRHVREMLHGVKELREEEK